MTDTTPKVAVEEDLFDSESTGGSLFKLDTIGQNIKGLIISKKIGKTKMGEAEFVTIQTAKEEITFIPTKALSDEIGKVLRQFGGVGKVIVDITYVEDKPGNFASPFKVFRTRAGIATESRLSALGITTFDSEAETGEDVPH